MGLKSDCERPDVGVHPAAHRSTTAAASTTRPKLRPRRPKRGTIRAIASRTRARSARQLVRAHVPGACASASAIRSAPGQSTRDRAARSRSARLPISVAAAPAPSRQEESRPARTDRRRRRPGRPRPSRAVVLGSSCPEGDLRSLRDAEPRGGRREPRKHVDVLRSRAERGSPSPPGRRLEPVHAEAEELRQGRRGSRSPSRRSPRAPGDGGEDVRQGAAGKWGAARSSVSILCRTAGAGR